MFKVGDLVWQQYTTSEVARPCIISYAQVGGYYQYRRPAQHIDELFDYVSSLPEARLRRSCLLEFVLRGTRIDP